MVNRALVIVVALFWWILAASATIRADEPPATEEAKSAAVRAKDLAAFQAFRSLAASQSYGMNDDELQGMIEQHVSALNGQPPHAMPAAADLHGTTDKRFQQINDSLLRKATQGLDPEGVLGLEKRLRDYLDHHDQIRAQFRVRYDEYLKKEFPGAVIQVGKRIASEQGKKLREALVGYIATGKLTAARVEMAFEQGKQEELVAIVEREVLQGCDPSWKRSLLVDAYAGFETNVQKAVSNGINQLQERLDVLKAAPSAHTLAGMVKELQARVDAVCDRQTKLARFDSLRGIYVDFSIVQTRVQKAANWHFDRAIAAVTQQLAGDLRTGTKRLPVGDQQAIETEIRSDVRAHHEAVSSRDLLKSKIDTLVAADRRWIPASVKTSVEAAHSPFDADFSQQDSLDIDRLLDAPKTVANDSWLALKSQLVGQYGKVVSGARGTIAAEQAEQHAPGLASKAWRPTEKEIVDDSGRQMDRIRLHTLSVWKGAPPGDPDVLDETWTLWSVGAQAGIEIGKQAITGQKNVVDRLRDQMADRMRATHGWTTADWINEYSTVAQAEWQQFGGSVAADYPRLFSATRQRIRAVVNELLGIVAHELEDEARRRAAEAQAQKDTELRDERKAAEVMKPTVPPPQAERKEMQSSSPPPKDTPRPSPESHANDGATKAPSGEKLSGGTGSDSEGTAGSKGTGNVGTGVGGSSGAKGSGNTEPGSTGTEKSGKPGYVRPEDAVLRRQVEMVDENYQGHNGKESIYERIKNDPTPIWSNYRTLFVGRVTNQWQRDDSSEVKRFRKDYPRLLPVVEQLISGLVAEAMGDRLRPGAGGPGGGGGYGDGYGDDPYGLYYTVYPIGFWGLLIIAVIMAGCWYWNIKYLRAYYSARTTTEMDPPRQSRNLLRVLGSRRPNEPPDSATG